MPRDLKFNIDLDNSRARAQANAFRADQQKLNAELLGDARAAENAKAGAARDAQGRFIKGSRDATEAVKKDFREQADEATRSFSRSKSAGLDSFAAVTVAAAAGRAAIGALQDIVGGLANAYTKAGEKSKEISSNFTTQRESLGNLAYLKGTKADNAFVLEQARFAASVGMTQAEATALQTAFMNSGAQFVGKGKSLDTNQADKFQTHMAKLSLARNLDPGVVAGMGGQLLGMKDYSKFGDKGADMALGDLSQSLSVLSAGSGDEGKLAMEVGKLAGFSLNEDELKGVFQSPTEVAKLISTTAEFKPEGQAEAAASALRALRGFGRKKGGATLKAAGVERTDDPFLAIKKVGKYAEAQARAGPAGTTPQDILNAGFDDSLGAEVIGGLYTKGIGKGVFEARDKTAAANAGPAAALAQNADFLRSERGMSRLGQADVALAKTERGLETSDISILRNQALAKLIRTKQIDTNATNFNDFLNQKASLGLTGDAETKRIDDEAQRMLIERSPAGTRGAAWTDIFNVSPTAREEDLNARMQRIREAGGDPLGGGTGDTKAVLERIAAAVEKQADKPKQAPPPKPIMQAPVAIRR